jgi:ribbon-helix-helix CopG family protein
MTDVSNTRPRKLVQLELPAETIERVDSLAADETISRTAWLRRLIIGVARSTDKVPA